MSSRMSMRRRITVLGLAATLLAACSEAPPPMQTVTLNATVVGPLGLSTSATAYLHVYHAWSGEGELRHPLGFIESFELPLGSSTIDFEYPLEGGEGLIVYAWADADEDGIQCTPTVREDLSDLVEVEDFPSDQVSVSLFLEVPCAGPDWFFPGPAPAIG